MFNIRKLKEKFIKEKIKIGRKVLNKFVRIEEEKIQEDIKKIARNALISGRKIIKEEDLK